MSLEDVQEQTKIRLRYLEAIERGDYTALPGPVYTRGFVKSFAECVGLDGAEVVKQLEDTLAELGQDFDPGSPHVYARAARAQKARERVVRRRLTKRKPSLRISWRAVLVLFITAAVSGVLYLVYLESGRWWTDRIVAEPQPVFDEQGLIQAGEEKRRRMQDTSLDTTLQLSLSGEVKVEPEDSVSARKQSAPAAGDMRLSGDLDLSSVSTQRSLRAINRADLHSLIARLKSAKQTTTLAAMGADAQKISHTAANSEKTDQQRQAGGQIGQRAAQPGLLNYAADSAAIPGMADLGTAEDAQVSATTRPANVVNSDEPKAPSDEETKAPIRLEVRAHQPCWVEARADGRQVAYRTLQSGEVASWTATGTFWLKLGYPQGVELYLNGRELDDLGRGILVLQVDSQQAEAFEQGELEPDQMIVRRTR